MGRSSLKNVCQLIDSAKNELPVEQVFLNDLKHSIELSEKTEKSIPSKTYKPSSLGGCIRQMYYQVAGIEPDEEDNRGYCLIGIANSGTDTHVRIQHYIEDMKNNGIDCEYIDVADFVKSRNLDYLTIRDKVGMETKLFHNELNMSFMTDGILRYKGHYYILEIKTETIMKWKNRTGVAPNHYAQGTAYSIAFGIPDVLFLYINRDMVDIKAFMFTPTDEMKADLIGKIDNCNFYLNKGECPPMPIEASPKYCQYCGYKLSCRKDG